jgi:O-antigen/teichoic acid export membrane protein
MSATFIRKSVLASGAGLVHAAGTFLSGIIVARLLGPEGTGIVSLATWLAIMAATVGGLGLTKALERYMPELIAKRDTEQADALKGRFFQFTLVSTILMSGVLVLVWVYVWRPVDGVTWALIIGCFIATVLGDFFFAYWRGVQRYADLAILHAVCTGLRLVALVIGAIMFGVVGALVSYILSFVIPAVLSFRMINKGGTVPPETRKQALRFTLYAWLVVIIYSLVWTRAEIVFISNQFGKEAVGLSAAGLGLANLTTLLPVLFSTALLPHLSQQRGEGAIEGMKNVYRSSLVTMCLLVLPVCLGTAAITPVLLPLIFGEPFTGAVPSGMILVAVSSIGIIAVCAKSVLFSLDRGKILLVSNLVGVVLVVGAGLLIIPVFGLNGAAWSRGIVHVVVIGIQLEYLRRLGFSLPFDQILRIFVAATLCAIGAWVVVDAMGGPLSLLVAIPLGAAIYLVALRLLRVLDLMDHDMLERAATQAPFGMDRLVRLGMRMLGTGRPVQTPAE